MTDYPVAIPLLAIQRLRCPKCRTRMMRASRRGLQDSSLSIRLGTFLPLGDWVFDKERQNEIYLEAAIRTERCNAAVRQRRVGERRGRLAVPKQGRVGIAGCQIGLA